MAAGGSKVFDLVVVGAGMFGSAAAFHASQIPHTSVCLVGPPEPQDRTKADIFGCWYDEGRIVNQAFQKPLWKYLTQKSYERYRQLEARTGVNIYREVGCLHVCDSREEFEAQLADNGAAVENITSTYQHNFPFLSLPSDVFITREKLAAGHLSPRQQVRAHQQAAREAGAQVVHKVVAAITPSQSHTHRWEVVTVCGQVVRCGSVLVAAGGFAALKPLFAHVAPNKVPLLQLRTQTVAYLQLSQEEAHRLRMMPTMLTSYPHGQLDGSYILPPIKYPNGKWYIKLGHGRMFEEVKSSLGEVQQWYRQQSGIPEAVQQLANLMHSILPGLQVEEVSGDGCLTSHTPDAQPYIDLVAEGFGVALGGNGYGAKASEEVGRLAARLTLLGEWQCEVPRDQVKVVWQPVSQL